MDYVSTPIPTAEILQVLWILAAVFIVLILYNVLFIVGDIRKIIRRVEGLTDEVESVMLKPLKITDQAVSWVVHLLEQSHKKKATPKKSSTKKKK